MKQKMNITIFHKFAERLLIFLTINSFFTGLLFLLRDIFVANGSNIINFFTIAAVSVTAIIIYSIFLIFFNERTSTANFIRLLFFYSLITGGILALLRHFFIFSAILVFICAVVQTVLYRTILEAFFAHDIFEIQCEAKNNTQLQKELYDYNIYLTDAAQGYKQNRGILLALLGVLIGGATIVITTNTGISFFSILSLFVYSICLACNFFIYSHYVREATFASNGFVNVFDYRLKIFFTGILICVICFIFGLVLSSNHSLINPAWLLKLIPNKTVNKTAAAPDYEMDIFDKRMMELQAFSEAVSQNEKDTKANNIIAILCGAFLIVGIAWFFLKPFITKTFSKYLAQTDLKRVLKRFFKNLKAVFWKLFHLKKKDFAFTSQNAERFKADMSEYLKASKKSKEKKAELDRLTVQFMKIIDWGEMNGIHYTKNLAPAEYTQQLKNKDAYTAGLLFEQALYAKECLTKAEEEAFVNAVNKAVKVERV